MSWFWWLGGPLPPLAELPVLYARRFGLEHGYRFDKQDLLWATPRMHTPEQFERWTDVVAIVHNHLVLARPFVETVRLPWERTDRPAPSGASRDGAQYCPPWHAGPFAPTSRKSTGAGARSNRQPGSPPAGHPYIASKHQIKAENRHKRRCFAPVIYV